MKDKEDGGSSRFRATFRVGNGYSMRVMIYMGVGVAATGSLLGTVIGTLVYLALGR